MGGGGNQPQQQNVSNTNNNVATNIETLIQNTFKRASQDQFITKAQFNHCLKVFQSMNLVYICNTYFSARLFDIFDQDRKGKISKQLIIQSFKKFMNDPQRCCKYTFKMYDSDNDKNISRRQFSDFFQKSWQTQVQIVNQRLKMLQESNAQQVYQWMKQRKQDINQISTQIFAKINQTNQNYISYKEFQKWISSGDYDMINFKYEDVIIKFPLHIDALININ